MAASLVNPIPGIVTLDHISDVAPKFIVARAFGGIVVDDQEYKGLPASYDHLNLRYVFIAAAGDKAVYALDVERKDVFLDSLFEAALSTIAPTPTQSWTLIEVAAKLRDQPAHLVLQQLLVAKTMAPLVHCGIAMQQPDHPKLWITVGRLT